MPIIDLIQRKNLHFPKKYTRTTNGYSEIFRNTERPFATIQSKETEIFRRGILQRTPPPPHPKKENSLIVRKKCIFRESHPRRHAEFSRSSDLTEFFTGIRRIFREYSQVIYHRRARERVGMYVRTYSI